MTAWPLGWSGGVVGCGSAGSRLARLLLGLGVPASALTGYDMRGASQAWPTPVQVAAPPPSGSWSVFGGVDPLRDMQRIVPAHDVWFVCVPARSREWYYSDLLRAPQTKAVFAEKPLGVTRDLGMLRDAVALTQTRGVVAQVGYCWRWHPAVAAAKAWLRDQSLGRISATASVALDMSSWPGRDYGDPLLECSHELDILRFCLGPALVAFSTRTAGRFNGVELRHQLGATSTFALTTDYRGGYWRGLTLRSEFGLFQWHTTDFDDPGIVETQSTYEPGLVVDRAYAAATGPSWHSDEMYRAQLVGFLAAAATGAAVRCSWQDGLAVVEIVAAANEKADASG